jgi:hypothetical protein
VAAHPDQTVEGLRNNVGKEKEEKCKNVLRKKFKQSSKNSKYVVFFNYYYFLVYLLVTSLTDS